MIRRNPRTGALEDYSDEQKKADAILNNIPATVINSPDEKVAMLSPDGRPVWIGKGDLGDALTQGFKYESTQQAADRLAAKDYDSPLLAAFYGGSRSFTLGLTDAAARAIDYLDGGKRTEQLKKLSEANPTATLVGDVAGVVGSGIGGALGKAGAATSAAILGEGAGQSLARKALALTASGAAEGGLQGLGTTITEQSLGSKEAVTESILRNVGIGALLGGGLNLAGGAAIGGLKKSGSSAWSWGKKTLGFDEADLQKLIRSGEAIPEGEIGAEGLFTKRAQDEMFAKEAAEAATRLPVRITEGTASPYGIIKSTESSLSQSPTIFGQRVKASVNNMWDDITKITEKLFSGGKKEAAADVGQRIEGALFGKLDAQMEEISSKYANVNRLAARSPVLKETRILTANALENALENSLAKNTTIGSQTRQIADMLKKRTFNLDELKQVTSEIKEFFRGGIATPGERKFASRVLGELEDLYENEFVRNSKQLVKNGLATRKEVSNFLSERYLANQAFKDFMQEIEGTFIKGAKIGRKGMRYHELRNFISESVGHEKLIDKLWQPNNRKFMLTFREKYPEVYRDLQRLKIAELAESTKNAKTDQIDFARALDKINKLENKDLLFGTNDLAIVEDLSKIRRALPDKSGPSGTAQGLRDIAGPFNPKLLASDFVNYHLYKNANKLSTIVRAVEAKETKALISAFTNSAEKAGAVARETSIGIFGALEKGNFSQYETELEHLQKLVASGQVDPDAYRNLAHMDDNVAGGVQAQAMVAANYLLQTAPRTSAKGYFNKKINVDRNAVKTWLKVAHTLDNPKSIIDDIRSGTITTNQVQALQQIYPNYYSKLLNIISSLPSEKISRRARHSVNIITNYATEGLDVPAVTNVYQETFAREKAKEAAQKQKMLEGTEPTSVQKLEDR